MKKIVLILTAILIGNFVLFSLLIPKNDFAGEKQLWKATKRFSKLTQRGKGIPAARLDRMIPPIERFIEEYPESPLRPHAHALLGDIYVLKKDYTAAHREYEEIINRYADQPHIVEPVITKIIDSYRDEETTVENPQVERVLKTLFNENAGGAMTKVLDLQYESKNFDRMLQTYERAMQDYPTTFLGIQAPLLIVKLYHEQGRPDQSRKALDAAIEHYREFIVRHENTPLELQAREVLVSCHLIQKDLNAALEVLGGMLIRFADSPRLTVEKVAQIATLMNALSVEMKNPQPAIAVYQEFIAANPEHKAAYIIKEGLGRLRK